MFDHIGSVADDTGGEHLAIGQLDMFPNLPFVLVPWIRGLDEISAGTYLENEIDDLLQGNIGGVGAGPASPANVITNAVLWDAFESMVQHFDMADEPATVILEAGGRNHAVV